MITISKSPTADTRTCDWAKVSESDLAVSSSMHIDDVRRGLGMLAERLVRRGSIHDYDKLDYLDSFHADFVTGFKEHKWWDAHRKLSRHHLSHEDGVPGDVNLIDVMEHLVDCVMAGMARAGTVTPVNLSPELLQRAVANTVEILKDNVEVK